MIQARVKPEYRFGNALLAFSRIEFIKADWRDVPTQFEAAARSHEWLDVRDRPVVEEGAIETVAPATVVAAEEETPTADQQLETMLAGEEPTTDQQLREFTATEDEEESSEDAPEAPTTTRRTTASGRNKNKGG